MGKLVVSENVSLDGVMQDPRGDEGIGRVDWFTLIGERDRQEWAAALIAEATAAEAMLLGRRSYEFFAQRYPSRRDALAERINSMPKYVVSATLENPRWSNTTVLGGEVATAAEKLKDEVRGEIVVYASGGLVPALFDHGLVDELRLMIYPCVLGAGRRLFGGTSTVQPLRLVESRTVGDTLALLTYRPTVRE